MEFTKLVWEHEFDYLQSLGCVCVTIHIYIESDMWTVVELGGYQHLAVIKLDMTKVNFPGKNDMLVR